MKIIERFFLAHMLAAVAAIAIGYAYGGYIGTGLVFVFLGAAWYTAFQRRMGGLENLILFIFAMAGALSFWLNVPGWLMLIGVVATLGAWDLMNFTLRLARVERVEFESGLGRQHMRRLGIIEGVGLLAGLAALTIHARIPLGWEIFLALLAVVGISQLVAFLRKQNED